MEGSAETRQRQDENAHAADSEILTVQELRQKPGSTEKFVARFRELDVLGLAATAADGELLEATMAESEDGVVVVTRWASQRGIEVWIASEPRVLVLEELEPYYAEPAGVRRFTIRSRFEARG
jgi:heme-degrading monooxygenase HmoA